MPAYRIYLLNAAMNLPAWEGRKLVARYMPKIVNAQEYIMYSWLSNIRYYCLRAGPRNTCLDNY